MGQEELTREEFEQLESLDQKIAYLANNANFTLNKQKKNASVKNEQAEVANIKPVIKKEEFEQLESSDQKIAYLANNASFILNKQKKNIPIKNEKAEIAKFKPIVKKDKQHIVEVPENVIAKLENNLKNKIHIHLKEIDTSKIKIPRYFAIIKNKPLITVPKFIIGDIKNALNKHTQFIRDGFYKISSKIVEAFAYTEEDERLDNIELGDKLQNKERKRIIKARKADFKFALKRERLALKRHKALRLKLKKRQIIAKGKAYITSVPTPSLRELRDNLLFKYGEMYDNYLDSNFKQVKAMKLADKLQEAENNLRRMSQIEDMIAALKAEDEIDKELEQTRSTGVRISR